MFLSPHLRKQFSSKQSRTLGILCLKSFIYWFLLSTWALTIYIARIYCLISLIFRVFFYVHWHLWQLIFIFISCLYYAALGSHQDNNAHFFDVPQSAHLLQLLYQMFIFIYILCLSFQDTSSLGKDILV